MEAFRDNTLVYSDTKEVTLGSDDAVINFALNAVSGQASLSVKLNYPEGKGVARITAALYDSTEESDSGSDLVLNSDSSVTFTSTTVAAGKNLFLIFYLYDSQNVKIGSYPESVFMTAGDSISVERSLDEINTYAASVYITKKGEAWNDSGLIIKAVSGSKEYVLSTKSGSNVYTASLPAGSYDIYNGSEYTGSVLIVSKSGSEAVTLDFGYCKVSATKNTFADVVSSLTEDAEIVLTGTLTPDDLSVIKEALVSSSYKIKLNLSQVTGLTELPEDGFRNCYSLEYIVLPETVTSIGNFAFDGCSFLEFVDIPDSVTSIGKGAFEFCSLKTISIPNSVITIGDNAFSVCSMLEYVYIPASVTSIGVSAFAYCQSLKQIEVDENNTEYTSIDGVLFTKDKTSLLCCPGCKEGSSYTIPDSTIKIESASFYGCNTIESVVIPDSVISIELVAFADNKNLKYATIGNSVKIIRQGAFYQCESLQSINIPASVVTIEDQVFCNCLSLSAINVDSNNQNYSSIDGILFSKDKKTIVCYPEGKKQNSYSIPDSVTVIEAGAFYKCTEIESVSIPNTVTSIGMSAFNGCTSLKSVIIPSSVIFVTQGSFSDCSSLTSITFEDTSTWYRTESMYEMNNKTGGIETDLSDPSLNVEYFRDSYTWNSWYKLD